MAVQIVSRTMRPARRDEYIVLMDDYGAELHMAVSTAFTPAQRAADIQAKMALHEKTQKQMEQYAAAAGIDLAPQKAEGVGKRMAMQKANGITPALAAGPALPAPSPASSGTAATGSASSGTATAGSGAAAGSTPA